MGLISSLGLDAVSGDPNDIPVGKYDGEVSKSEYVLSESKDKVSHVVTYKVTEGDRKGASKQVWYDLYTEIKDAEGNFPKSVDDIKAGKPAMSEDQKNWYKAAIMKVCGVTRDEANTVEPESWVGKQVTFGVSEKNGYRNVSFVEPRQAQAQAVTEGLGGFGGAVPGGMPQF